MTRKNARSRRAAFVAMQVLIFAGLTNFVHAGVQEFEDEERPMWFDAASAKGNITTIGFDELGASNILVTEQYAQLGVHFTYLGNFTRGPDFIGYPQDGWGLDGNEMIHLVFDDLQIGIATDHPGTTQIRLYESGQLVFTSAHFGGSGNDRFGGIVGVSFDEAIIVDPFPGGEVFADDLHFVSIPTPPTLISIGVLLAIRTRRRSPR